ncbi:hypothetical protein BDQ12DRAFT_732185 [Crucibulum laeve]|uniref:Non-repetitive/WGA-negative nucleoporin C-terminal-domain-containing protein n=1 Tax=Crucibulum laeve TaxID=68775 RepID=A0A5C3MN11_9AGAR|nr:hypothetical protein BDQ12DRAFT_732185 [Crucibulum laeve]
MASFSPSPAPRRSTRNRQRPNSPLGRTRVPGGSAFASRVATPLVQDRNANDNERFRSAMDVDETSSVFSGVGSRSTGETVFAKSEELTVSFYANLPLEVTQMLRNTDFYRNPCTGDVDTLTGYAIVASVRTCYVWQHAQAIKGTPTCYIFSCPENIKPSPPFHALVPNGTSREPGLILLSPSGEIRFWDSISIGLAGGEHYAATRLAFKNRGEEVNDLVRADARTFIASSSLGNLYRLALTSSGGKYQLASHTFSRPAPSRSFSRLLPSIFTASPTSSSSDDFESIYSIAIGPPQESGENNVWAISKRRVQKWILKSEGWEEFVMEYDLADLVEPALEKAFGLSHNLDLEMLDMAVNSNGNIVVLISHAPDEPPSTAMDMTAPVRRIYSLATISVLRDFFKVENIKSVPYQSTFTSGVNVHPRIQLLYEGSLVSVQYGDAVALCAIDSEYQDRLELKSTTDRTLGVGVNQADNTLLVLTATTMLKASLDMEKITAFDPETGRTNLIKSIMMQAILYGALPENPLHFSFPPEVDEESLMRGAEQLSEAVLESDPEVVRQNHDLGAQLAGRKDRLMWLISFINENTVLGKMSQRCRQQLAIDAEKLHACQQLWIQYNELLHSSRGESVLKECVHRYMMSVHADGHEDIMRAFFRYRVKDIGDLIRGVMRTVEKASDETHRDPAEFLPEANRIVITVLRSAFNFRATHLALYGIELPMIRPWTSRSSIIDVVLTLFEASTKVIDYPAPGSASSNRNQEPATQLPDLAAILFECIQERLNWLGSTVVADDPGAVREEDELEQRFNLLRPEVLETLRRCDFEEAAFTLAENYRDFSTLAALCHRETIYPPEENPNIHRIESYIHTFKEDFTRELYQWYIQHGELRVMFSQEDSQSPFIENFIAERPSTAISWIYDLGKKRYGDAASALVTEAQEANNLEAKHLMLSIGKLSHLADVHATGVQADESMLNTLHNELDFVSVHESMLQEFRSALEGVRGRHSLDSQIDIIVKAKASGLVEKKAFIHVFKDLIRQLLQGKALSIEDAVDLLTLKDVSESKEEYSMALEILSRVTHDQLPDARRLSAFRTVWRRIYIHDNWNTICNTTNISDYELIDRYRRSALYATLRAILPQDKENKPPGFEASPSEALQVPSYDEIVSRWPGMSPDQVDAIIQDYNLECDTLGELNVDDVCPRVREVALQDYSPEY